MVFLVLLGMLGFVVGIVMLILSFIKRNKKNRPLLIILASFILVIVGALNMPTSANENSEVTNHSSETRVSSSTVEIDNSSSSSSETKSTQEENERILSEQMEMYNDGSYPYATGATIETSSNGDIDHIQLNVSTDWNNFDEAEKEKYAGMLKGISAPFVNNDKLPFMQISVNGEVVARSEITNTNKIKIIK